MIPYSMNPMGVDSYDDLYWLRKIRDANPTSQLPSLWLDSEDPYTQWDGVIWNEEIVTQLDINSKSITSLTNINKLNGLQYLDCQSNQLTTLNLSGLTGLQYLDCNSNQLTTLDVSSLTSLQELYCYSNQLTTLDVSGLTSLKRLQCYSNQLTTLDVSSLTSLQYLYCYSNQLTTLDVSSLTSLKHLHCFYNQLTSIPTLTSRGSITNYNFTYNNFTTSELDRFRALGFTDDYYLLPQNP